jgi:DNA invertase Pin-like site-specific DNA recombinase
MTDYETVDVERKTAVGYICIASIGRGGSTGARSAITAQQEQIQAVARARNLHLGIVQIDVGCEGDPLERTGIKEILDAAASSRIDYCIIAGADRIAQNVATYADVEAHLETLGTSIIDATDPTKTTGEIRQVSPQNARTIQ